MGYGGSGAAHANRPALGENSQRPARVTPLPAFASSVADIRDPNATITLATRRSAQVAGEGGRCHVAALRPPASSHRGFLAEGAVHCEACGRFRHQDEQAHPSSRNCQCAFMRLFQIDDSVRGDWQRNYNNIDLSLLNQHEAPFLSGPYVVTAGAPVKPRGLGPRRICLCTISAVAPRAAAHPLNDKAPARLT